MEVSLYKRAHWGILVKTPMQQYSFTQLKCRVPEAVLIAMVTTVLIYVVTIFLGTCVQFSFVNKPCMVRSMATTC